MLIFLLQIHTFSKVASLQPRSLLLRVCTQVLNFEHVFVQVKIASQLCIVGCCFWCDNVKVHVRLKQTPHFVRPLTCFLATLPSIGSVYSKLSPPSTVNDLPAALRTEPLNPGLVTTCSSSSIIRPQGADSQFS